MTIRLNYEGRPGKIKAEFSRSGDDVYNLYSDSAANTVLATCDTLKEAEEAKRAFEQVLLPRFTRDEAIAIVQNALGPIADDEGLSRSAIVAVRAVVEALAAAGAFSDATHTCPVHSTQGACKRRTMADLLDAAGIR